jgi:pilus assembly protein Flp/PilA
MRKYLRLWRLPMARRRRAAVRLARMAFHDERGGEALEYALIAGLIVVGAISIIACVGTKVAGRWTSLSSQA